MSTDGAVSVDGDYLLTQPLPTSSTHFDGANATNILNALQSLGGQTNFSDVTFTPPLTPGGNTCTGDIILTVPRKNGTAQNKKTVTLTAAPWSGAADINKLDLVCSPE